MKQYIVDAFTEELFAGNPAAVLPCRSMPSADLMLKIAVENNYSETAFVVRKGEGRYDLKWFTPGGEVELCGHATLATSFVLHRFADPGVGEMHFDTLSGELIVRASAEGGYTMDFPLGAYKQIPVGADILAASGGLAVEAFYDGEGGDMIVIFPSEESVRGFVPNYDLIRRVDGRGFVITAAASPLPADWFTAELAAAVKPIFLEIVIAPSYTPEALEILATKKNLRVMEVDMTPSDKPVMQYVGVAGGLLAQHLDTAVETITPEMCVTKVKPSAALMADLEFGWKIVKHIKSNAIAVVRDGHTIGVGAGQTNRVGSAEIALKQAQAAGFCDGLVLASDGFLPFDDTVALAAQYGVTAIVQPGGSIRDADAVAKADELGITMLFTGVRHFKH